MIRETRTRMGRSGSRAQRVLGALALGLVVALATQAAALEPGDKAPDFSLERIDGKGKVQLSKYRGKVVWLDFWASWCAPCLKALPELEKMRGRFPAKKFQIVAINVDEDVKRAKKFLAKNPIGYPSGLDPKGEMPAKYGLENMPTSFLIDQKGVVRYVHAGYRSGDIEEIEAQIKKALGGK